ncbi:flavodoxin domain-containing protein [Amycolatopsis pigmentata]|uniref:Flavodoxin domain-containing protein n=1 Tax=Amycolatopsis pigmentata TaxID=450801 RepID=A0ABW5FWJ3_9PSEU
MTVLVAVASRHGATREIADVIGETLGSALASLDEDAAVDVLFAENAYDLSDYDAFVLGSAVYNGHWVEAARDLVERHDRILRSRPVWLFSSGPARSGALDGDAAVGSAGGADGAVDVARQARLSAAYQHRLFPGKLDRRRLCFAERAVAGALGLRDGDYRDWQAVRAWARVIASTLHASRAPAPASPDLVRCGQWYADTGTRRP